MIFVVIILMIAKTTIDSILHYLNIF